MTRYRKTRIIAQDMKTGEFAYLDQLIKDGYYPNLWVLPKNYDPPMRAGESIRLPLQPIFNFSPLNVNDNSYLNMQELVNPDTGIAIGLPTSVGNVGTLNYFANVTSITGISSTGSVGSMATISVTGITGLSSTGSLGVMVIAITSSSISGLSSEGDAAGEMGMNVINGAVSYIPTGQSSTGSVGTIPAGSGWGQGGGWGSNGWGSA